MGEIIASTGDKTGSWTGYGEVDPNYYITADLEGGRLPEVIDAGDPGVLISHWQGFYGIHNDDRRGFRAFQTVVRRLEERDPKGERTRWRKCSEITNYAIAREMADIKINGEDVLLTLPVQVPELTLCVRDVTVTGVTVDGAPLTQALTRSGFEDGTFYRDGDVTFVAFTPKTKNAVVRVES
jgi:hypothetical protein